MNKQFEDMTESELCQTLRLVANELERRVAININELVAAQYDEYPLDVERELIQMARQNDSNYSGGFSATNLIEQVVRKAALNKLEALSAVRKYRGQK